MDKIHRVWEIELQAVLEINKIGHRRRILYSISRDTENDPKCDNNNSHSTTASTNDIDSKSDANSNNETVSNSSSSTTNNRTEKKTDAVSSTSRHRNRKNRAPQPPTQTNNLEIRQPSELLLTNQGNLNAQWKHTSAALVSESIKYEAFVSLHALIYDDLYSVLIVNFIIPYFFLHHPTSSYSSISARPLSRNSKAPSRQRNRYRNSRRVNERSHRSRRIIRPTQA